MEKRIVFPVVLHLLLIQALFSQSLINPSDSFYEDLQIWDTLGLVSNLPPLRPYPEPLVKSILKEVMESGSPLQWENARYQYDRLFGKPLFWGAEGTGLFKTGMESPDSQIDLTILALGNFHLTDFFSISVDLNLLFTNKEQGSEVLPRNAGYRYDTYSDTADMGPLNVIAGLNTNVAAGTEKMWIQAGVSRSSWGDFYDNGVVIGPQTDHTGNISYVIRGDNWNYTLAMFMLAASKDAGNLDSPYPEKFMAMHAVSFSPLPWLDLAVYENMIYGKRFEPLYVLPISPYMTSQQLVGVGDDNLQMGFSFKIRPGKQLSWASNLFLDDAHFNDLVRLQFDTKIRIAVQTGISWVPLNPFVRTLQLDYTIATPYMYTHSDSSSDNMNYQNYTNNGKSLGAAIPPNSDRITVTGKFNLPVENMRLDTSLVFMRHANVNESLPWDVAAEYLDNKGGEVSDGGIMDSPNAGNGYFDYAHHHLMFMEQETKQYTFQIGIKPAWELPRLPRGKLSLTAGYVFEYIYNDGVDTSLFTGYEITDRTKATEGEIKQALRAAKDIWRGALHDSMNHYFTIGIKIVFD
jgi:hypothetical protein